MSNAQHDKILERVRALAALANPENNPFPAEVAAASAKMQKLMDEYNISLAEVLMTEQERTVEHFVATTGKVILGSLKTWHWGLGRVIARITATRSYASGRLGQTVRDPKGKPKRGHSMSFFGAPASTEVASQLFDEWVVTIDHMATAAVAEYIEELEDKYEHEMKFMGVKQVRHLNLGSEHPNVWRDSWLAGVVAGIDASLDVQESERSAETSTALAVIGEELMVAYRDFASNFKSTTPSRGSGNHNAYRAGHSVGKNLSLTAKKLNG